MMNGTLDYREMYRQRLSEAGLLEIYQRYLDEMKEHIKAGNVQHDADKCYSDMVTDFLHSPTYDQTSFDEFSVIWEQYKLQTEEMGRLMQSWINDQYHVFVALKEANGEEAL